MPDHSELSEWYKDPKAIVGALIMFVGGLKALRYRRKPESPLAPPLTVAETAENSDRIARLEGRVLSQQRLLMQTREELTEVSLSLELVSGRVQRLELTERDDRRQLKDALSGINDRVSELVKRLDDSTQEDGRQL
jgi:hypothetical protein